MMPDCRSASFSALLCLVLAGLGAASARAASKPPAPVDRLLRAEGGFAAVTGRRGIRDGFLQFLAPDGVLFRPGPVPGREWLATHPPTPGRLAWAPEFAELAASGDLGWTMGPWEYTTDPEAREQPDGFGHFVSVWQLQTDGSFQVLVDLGTDHARQGPLPGRATTRGPGRLARKPNPATTRRLFEALKEAEASLGQLLASGSEARAIQRWYDGRATVLRQGRPPSPAAEFQVAATASPPVRLQAVDGSRGLRMSLAGDLAASWGAARHIRDTTDGSESHRGYLRIWRHAPNKPWRVILDVALDYRPPEVRE